jgi:hypothetical protein
MKYSKGFANRKFQLDDSEVALDSVFSMGGMISKGIPWNRFSEIEIQSILKIHFENLNYTVVWRHKEDPANERGIDLECQRNNEKLLIAVKRKPKKEDLAQLIELSDYEAARRYYIYIGGATQSFRDKIPNFPKIDFLAETRLEKELNKSHLTLTLRIHNSKANQAMLHIMRGIINTIKEKDEPEIDQSINPKMIRRLWELKDRSVTIHKCASMAQLMLENPNRVGELSNEQMNDLMIWILDYMYVYGFNSLQRFFTDLPKDFKPILNHVYQETKIRSNWFMLFAYRPGLIPGMVDMYLKEYDEEKKDWEKAGEFFDRSKKNGEIIPDIQFSYLDDIAERFRRLAVWGEGLEGTIDYVFEHAISGDIIYK